MENHTEVVKKPIYKRKWFLITVGIIVVIILLPKGNSNKDNNVTEKTNKTEGTEVVKQDSKVTIPTLKDTLSSVLFSINTSNDQYFSELKEQHISEGVDRFNEWVEVLKRCEKSDDTELLKESKLLRKKIQSIQVKYFPVMRKNYVDFARTTLFENNIEVSSSGKGSSTILLVGGYFANNKNISELQKKLSDMLYKLRFKKTQYKWFKYDDGYYYTLESPSDNELI
jgi:hypothetical protein